MIYTSKIEQHNLDFTGRASITTLMARVVATAGMDAHHGGFGISELNDSGHTWVLLKFAMELHRIPTLGTEITTDTWIESVSRLFSLRNFALSDENGEVFAEARSQWCIIDLANRKAVDINATHPQVSSYSQPRSGTIALPKKLTALTGSTRTSTHIVKYSDTDFNRHLNAVRYVELMLNEVPLELISKSKSIRLDLHYIAECYLGEEIQIKHTHTTTTSQFEITKTDGTLSARAAIQWQ